MNQLLTVLYTHDLHGEIQLLPRLASALRAARAAHPRSVYIDLGEACGPQAWHCAETGGRSMLVALDGVGCAAARADGLSPEARALLGKAILSMHAVDDAHPARTARLAYRTTPDADPQADLTLYLHPADQTAVTDGRLLLARLARRTLGVVTVDITQAMILDMQAVPITGALLPDPTISGLVEFVLNEARLAARKRGAP
jgi:hypothetical protein